jgi:hypothetical protein
MQQIRFLPLKPRRAVTFLLMQKGTKEARWNPFPTTPKGSALGIRLRLYFKLVFSKTVVINNFLLQSL